MSCFKNRTFSHLIFVNVVFLLFLFPQSAAAALDCWDYNLTWQFGESDSAVNVNDLNLFVSYVSWHKTGYVFVIPSTSPWFDPVLDLDGNNVINVGDLNAFIIFVNIHKTGPTFVVRCM